MYAATVDTLHLTFQASGSLWQDALVMQDRETGSLWSQISGECIQGPMQGKHLTLFPSFHTTFAEFRRDHPSGVVLKKPERGEAASPYASYFDDSAKLGIFDRVDDFLRLPAKSKIYGLRIGERQIAIAEDFLRSRGWVVVDNVTPAVLVTLDPAGHTAAAFSLDSGLVPVAAEIAVEGAVILYGESSARWDARTGRAATEGVADLPSVPLLSAFWFAWASFFPDTEVIR